MKIKTNKQNPISRTLFDPNYLKHHRDFKTNFPYPLAIDWIYNAEDSRFTDLELCIFSDVLEDEYGLYCSRGNVSGPLVIRDQKGRVHDLSRIKNGFYSLPPWVEEDGLELRRCSADGILLIERGTVFSELVNIEAWRTLNLVLVTGFGIPRLSTRRFLHRLSARFNLPVYVLADNDTWGYYIFSVLKRGLMGPQMVCPQLSIPKLRYLGIRAGDAKVLGINTRWMIDWEKHWDLRLRFMRRYSCFKSLAWRNEFNAFKKQGKKLELPALITHLGPDRFTKEYLHQKIKRRHWLV